MAANLSDNLKKTRAPSVGAFALRRYDRGIREGALHQYPCHIAVLLASSSMHLLVVINEKYALIADSTSDKNNLKSQAVGVVGWQNLHNNHYI